MFGCIDMPIPPLFRLLMELALVALLAADELMFIGKLICILGGKFMPMPIFILFDMPIGRLMPRFMGILTAMF